MVFPDQLLIGWAMIAVAVIGGIWLALFHFEVNRLKTAIAIAVGIAMGGCAAWYYWPSIQDNIPYQTAIAREFKLARTPSLGNPLRGIETTTDAYMAAHEHAMIICFRIPVNAKPSVSLFLVITMIESGLMMNTCRECLIRPKTGSHLNIGSLNYGIKTLRNGNGLDDANGLVFGH
jgi:hypothetical protein